MALCAFMRRQLRAYETNREDWLTKQRRSLVSPGLSQGLRTRARRTTYDFLTCVANTICIYICIYGHSRAYAASPYASGTALCLSYPKTGLEQKGKRTEPYKSQALMVTMAVDLVFSCQDRQYWWWFSTYLYCPQDRAGTEVQTHKTLQKPP